ncbi:MAG: pseudouridine synthase [archaeon]
MKVRLQVYLARTGISPSRRKAEVLIKDGKILVNGKVAELGSKVDTEKDKVTLAGQGGQKLKQVEKKIYIMLNKPVDYLVAKSDTRERKLAQDLLKKPSINNETLTSLEFSTVFNVGRLDYNTEGLLLFTNDGEFALKLAHPRYHVKKTYIAKVEGKITDEAVNKMTYGLDIKIRDGHELIEYHTRPADVRVLGRGKENFSVIVVKLKEGRKRQVRRMLDAVGFPVISLKRIQVGSLKLETLPLGRWRFLTKEEISSLK